MPRCELDQALERFEIGGFLFPLGVYPVEPMVPKPGYSVDFEPGDGSDELGEWEEWPDRYVYDIVVPANRLEPMWRALLAQMPPRIYPILDYIGHDAYREIDPYIAYELVGQDRLIDSIRRYRDFFFEDGMVGFGAVCDTPFSYVFLDEHKVFTVRTEPEGRAKIEQILEAFELEEVAEPAGSDAAAHEHRGVLLTPKDRPDLLTGEEIIEHLRETWQLVLNIDPESNLDDEGIELGITHWRGLVRCSSNEDNLIKYAEVVLAAGSLIRAEELAHEATTTLFERDRGDILELSVFAIDRLSPKQSSMLLDEIPSESRFIARSKQEFLNLQRESVLAARWLD